MEMSQQQLKTMFLRQRQSLPLALVVEMSRRRVRIWREHWQNQGKDVYVSLGGKDSHALLHLVRSIYPDVPGVFVDTGLEYPEVRELNLRTPNVVVLKPAMPFNKVVEKYGYPVISKKMAQYISEIQVKTGRNNRTINLRMTGWRNNGECPECGGMMRISGKTAVCQDCGFVEQHSPMSMISQKWMYLSDAPFKISHKCCKVMKVNPLRDFAKESGMVPIIGTTSDESSAREHNYIRFGCNAFDAGNPISTPIIFWTEQHVLEYLRVNRIEVAGCYGEQENRGGEWRYSGAQRTGCMFCMFGAHLEQEPNRFQLMESRYPAQYRYCMETLGIREVLEYCRIPFRNEQLTLFDTKEGS